MGRQVQFYMTFEDEKQFLSAVSRQGEIRLIHGSFATGRPDEIQPIWSLGSSSDDWALLVASAALPPCIISEFVPTLGIHCIDEAASEVVQFNRCKPVKNWLANGRLWFDVRSGSQPKSPEFVKWADSLLKWIRKNYHRDPDGVYVGPQALELSAEGRLQLGAPMTPSAGLE